VNDVSERPPELSVEEWAVLRIRLRRHVLSDSEALQIVEGYDALAARLSEKTENYATALRELAKVKALLADALAERPGWAARAVAALSSTSSASASQPDPEGEAYKGEPYNRDPGNGPFA